jgi:hypothetical protein
MKIYKGKEGLEATWQAKFPKTVKCVHCQGQAHHAFTAQEGHIEEEGKGKYICDLRKPKGKKLWLHDAVAVAVYFCEDCLFTTSLYNQA